MGTWTRSDTMPSRSSRSFGPPGCSVHVGLFVFIAGFAIVIANAGRFPVALFFVGRASVANGCTLGMKGWNLGGVSRSGLGTAAIRSRPARRPF
jgi:hypothetical protein